MRRRDRKSTHSLVSWKIVFVKKVDFTNRLQARKFWYSNHLFYRNFEYEYEYFWYRYRDTMKKVVINEKTVTTNKKNRTSFEFVKWIFMILFFLNKKKFKSWNYKKLDDSNWKCEKWFVRFRLIWYEWCINQHFVKKNQKKEITHDFESSNRIEFWFVSINQSYKMLQKNRIWIFWWNSVHIKKMWIIYIQWLL